jgi:hypothetical protein
MNRARHVVAATLVGAIGIGIGGFTLFAQDPPKAPEFKSVLAGKKFNPPLRGPAEVDFIRSPTKREGTTLVTKIQVKNASSAPIPRLTIAEIWYDKNNNIIPGGTGVVAGLLQPGEIQSIEIRTQVNPTMTRSMLQFSHANGTVPKPHEVKSFSGSGKESATKKAPAKKK